MFTFTYAKQNEKYTQSFTVIVFIMLATKALINTKLLHFSLIKNKASSSQLCNEEKNQLVIGTFTKKIVEKSFYEYVKTCDRL